MRKLDKAYKALAILESLSIPIGREQKDGIALLEEEYLRREVVPLLKDKMSLMLDSMRSPFRMRIKCFSGKDVNISLETDNDEDVAYYGRKSIKVIFPNGKISCKSPVWETLKDVVVYAGVKKVMKLGITSLGINIISNSLHPQKQYHVSQKELGQGLFLLTASSTKTKYEQINMINKQLKLGLIVSMV